MFLALLILFALVGVLAPVVRFIGYVFVVLQGVDQQRSSVLTILRWGLDAVTLIGLPVVYLYGFGPAGEEGLFSGAEQWLWYTWIVLYTSVYFGVQSWQRLPKLRWEVAWNTLLGSGVWINILVMADLAGPNGAYDATLVIGNGPIILLLLMMLHKRHRLFQLSAEGEAPIPEAGIPELLDDQLLPSTGQVTSVTIYPPGFSLALLQLPFLQKVGLFLAVGGMLVLLSTIPGRLLGWEYVVL